eukprot:403357892
MGLQREEEVKIQEVEYLKQLLKEKDAIIDSQQEKISQLLTKQQESNIVISSAQQNDQSISSISQVDPALSANQSPISQTILYTESPLIQSAPNLDTHHLKLDTIQEEESHMIKESVIDDQNALDQEQYIQIIEQKNQLIQEIESQLERLKAILDQNGQNINEDGQLFLTEANIKVNSLLKRDEDQDFQNVDKTSKLFTQMYLEIVAETVNLDSLLEKHEKLQNDKTSLDEKFKALKKTSNQSLKNEFESTTKELQGKIDTKSQIQDSLNERIKEYIVIEQDLQQRLHKSESLNREREIFVEKLEAEKQQIIRHLNKIKEEKEGNAEQLQQLKEDYTQLNDDYNETNQEKRDLEQQVQTQMIKIDKKDSFIQQLQLQIDQLSIQIEERERIISTVKKSNDENKQKVRTLESKIKQLQSGKLKEAKEINAKLESERNVLTEMLSSANKQLKMRETELKAERKKVEKLEKIAQINQIQQQMNPNQRAQQQNHNQQSQEHYHHGEDKHQMISGFTDFNDRDHQFMDEVEDTVQQMKQNLLQKNQSVDRLDYNYNNPQSSRRTASFTPVQNKSLIKNQSLNDIHSKNAKQQQYLNNIQDGPAGGISPEMKQKLDSQIRAKQLLDRIKPPKDQRERQSIEYVNQLNEKKDKAKFSVKYDKDLNDYQSIINKPTFKNNSNNIRGLFSHGGVELPEINQNHHRKFYPQNNFKSNESLII